VTIQVDLLGGFGEKGRTCIAVRRPSGRVLFDLGIKVGASGADYYPALDGPLDDIEAVLISHAHEDHVGALSWLLAKGYRGRILMTAETKAEAPATLAGYADPHDLARHPFPADAVELFEPGDTLSVGGLEIATGRSGHVVGGVWFAIDDGSHKLVYCADVVPESTVFVMDPMPACDLLVFDASYGADPVSGAERAAAIAAWIAAHPQGCLLPTPLSGRSLELIAALATPFAVHAGMRSALEAQIEAGAALLPGIADTLRRRLAAAGDWLDGDPLPGCPLLCDDGMGKAGPSARLLPLADAKNYPVLLSGHLPAGSPGERLHAAGRAAWIRMPTHPTLAGNVAIWKQAGRPAAIGHSCPPADLATLKPHIPALRAECRTGDRVSVP
jgi:phosphoribosyl 1,2-cyclic phosphodiesterase